MYTRALKMKRDEAQARACAKLVWCAATPRAIPRASKHRYANDDAREATAYGTCISRECHTHTKPVPAVCSSRQNAKTPEVTNPPLLHSSALHARVGAAAREVFGE